MVSKDTVGQKGFRYVSPEVHVCRTHCRHAPGQTGGILLNFAWGVGVLLGMAVHTEHAHLQTAISLKKNDPSFSKNSVLCL